MTSGNTPSTQPVWRRRSRCEAAQCVEVALTGRGVAVRDSKLGAASPVLTFTPAEWAAFTTAARAGDYDLQQLAAAPPASEVTR